ncbi:MAG: leucyl/phenylalanyl-tRNA--protein transferase [Ferruginibacter sp.]
MFLLTSKLFFPPVDLADADGLLAMGGDISTERLLLAYKNGIFPWYNEEEPILWWSPDPRFVLFPEKIKVSKSMHTVLQNGSFRFVLNRNFKQVMENCKNMPREGQEGTWIQPSIIEAYTKLHQLGHAICAEAWKNGVMVGGVYGIKLGNIFFGESMFSKESNASKFAFINLVSWLQLQQVAMIDCQIYTAHLESLGATMITRKAFCNILKKEIK